jgi:hypothetical protein
MVRPKVHCSRCGAIGSEVAFGASAAGLRRQLSRECYGLASLFKPPQRIGSDPQNIGVKETASWATMARPMLHEGLVEHQEPGVPVEGLERVDVRVKRQDLGREHRRGRPSCHQAATTARMVRPPRRPVGVLSQVSMADSPASLGHHQDPFP